MSPKHPLQVLGAALISLSPVLLPALTSVARARQGASQAASQGVSSYERLRAQMRATRVESPEQVRDLREQLAGRAVEIAGRVVGVMSNRGGRTMLLQYAAPDGEKRTFALAIPPEVEGDPASMRALRPDATVRLLARVAPAGAEPMLVLMAATSKAAPVPLFRDQDGEGDVVIMAPVNGALPLPPVTSGPGGSGLAAIGPGNDPDAAPLSGAGSLAEMPRARVPQVRAPRSSAAGSAAGSGRSAVPGATLRRGPAPRAYLAPPLAGARRRMAPTLAPLPPSYLSSAQTSAKARSSRNPARPASRGGQPSSRQAPRRSPASEPTMFADDERIEAQVPAYESLVRRFNKKLSAAQVNEIARALLTAGYRENMDPRFLAAIIAVESDFDIYCLSSSGAMGLGQIMPFNLPEVGMQKADAWNPTKNILGTAMLLRGHLDDFQDRPNGTLLAVAAYNAGPNAVKRAGYKVPKGAQVQRYVWKVYYRYKEFAPELFR